ncbi:MAG: hypothetical protein IJV83_02600 [Clostridia bacterium]|nr:hypothetical protein [Clostridia bacterium]
MLKSLLKEKAYLPILKMNDGTPVTAENWRERRAELKEALEVYSYGRTPALPLRVWGEVLEQEENAYAGKVRREKVQLSFETEKGVMRYPIEIFVPKKEEKPPVLLHIAFRPVPDRYIPVEEITDGGYALVVVCYKDMVNDNLHGDFSDGIAAHFGVEKDRKPEEWGKIGMWAYGASRVLDYILAERTDMDGSRVAVIGHSRLGKTALWCAAYDERFAAAVSNDSGYGGAASSKYGTGETIDDFMHWGSWEWFCENFKNYQGKENEKPYDQSFLTAMIAPRYVLVNSAKYDKGADPLGEYLTTKHASAAWEILGEKGLICPEDRLPECGELFADGNVGYFYRDGMHFLSREDWNAAMRFLDKKFGRK